MIVSVAGIAATSPVSSRPVPPPISAALAVAGPGGDAPRGDADRNPPERSRTDGLVKPQPKLVKGDAFAHELDPARANFGEQLKTAPKPFRPPAKLPPRSIAARQC